MRRSSVAFVAGIAKYAAFSGVLRSLRASLLLAVAARILNDRREAEDVLQDVFAQIWQKSHGFDAELGSLASWAVALTRNKAIDRIRAATRRRRLIEEIAISVEAVEPAPAASASEQLHGEERAASISRQLRLS